MSSQPETASDPAAGESALDARLEKLHDRLVQRLLAARSESGLWTGRLSSSALSTSTAIIALSLAARGDAEPDKARRRSLVERGLAWLAQTQNDDGGFGDTIRSRSNISTALLALGALRVAARDAITCEGLEACQERLESYVRGVCGGLDAEALSGTILRKYGSDQTFSVPILMVLALSGLLGPGQAAWRRVPQLPFALAALPRGWFKHLSLPVVSYAIPALIAIGQVKHHFDPGWNPLGRPLRSLTRARTDQVLEEVQPENGGFLEATPLTSFVTMARLAMEDSMARRDAVVQRGLAFLEASIRVDGAWPIDTNLETWGTSLSVHALAEHELTTLPEEDRRALLDWYLDTQYKVVHPYTDTPPGGWAWTSLPGGVPDGDDSSGAIIALRRLLDAEPDASAERREQVRQAATKGLLWLLGLQNRDGGIATFCRGWGTLPFDRSNPDITAHALLAASTWLDELEGPDRARVESGVRGMIRFLERSRNTDGSWHPLWFGNENAPDDQNPVYGTARVVVALSRTTGEAAKRTGPLLEGGLAYLRSARNEDGSYGGAVGVEGSIEETALALHAMAAAGALPEEAALAASLAKLDAWTDLPVDVPLPATPIGLYFASLWYFEDIYPLSFTTAALGAVRSSRQS